MNYSSGSSTGDGIIAPFIWFINLIVLIVEGIWGIAMWLVLAFSSFLSYLPFLAVIFGLYFIGGNIIPYVPETISQLEHAWRCDIQPMWVFPLEPMVKTAADIYENFARWTNALAFVQRNLSFHLFIEIWGQDFFDWVAILGRLGGNALLTLLNWTFVLANPIYDAFPAYATLLGIATEFIPQSGLLLIDMCQDTSPIINWFTRSLNSQPLSCCLFHLTNLVIGGFQYTVSFCLSFLGFLLTIVVGGGTGQDFSAILKGQTLGPGSNLLPSFSKDSLKERFSSAGVYLGIFLNDVFAITICSFKSEMNANGDSNLANALYLVCIQDPSNRLQLFGVIGPICAAFVRFGAIWFAVLPNAPQWLYEMAVQPPGPRYLIDTWYGVMWKQFFDTIRPPPLRYNYSLSVQFPTPIPGSDVSSILWPNQQLYGPDINLTCNNYNNSRQEIPCLECGQVAQYDAQTIVCQSCVDLDNITANVANITFWVPWVCCGVASYARSVVAVVDFFAGVLVYTANYDRLGYFLADQNHYDIIANEIGGSPFALGGLLGCLFQVAHGFDPRLDSLALAISQYFKAQLEALRMAIIAVCRFVNDIMNTGEPGFASYVCVTNNECVELERSLSHLRRPRDPIWDPQFQYVNVLTTFPPAFVDSACEVLNFQLLASFMSVPATDIPDFCCAPHYFIRLNIEYYKMMALTFIASVQSIITIFDPSIPFTLTVVEFAACLNPTECINTGAFLSDMQDLMICPCLLLIELQTLMQNAYGSFAFNCICDLINGLLSFSLHYSRASWLTFSCLSDVMYCLANGWPDIHCNVDLPTRIFNDLNGIFSYYAAALASLATAFSSVGCTLGLPWVGLGFNCIGHRYIWFEDSPPCVTSLDGPGICTMSDRLQFTAFNLFTFTTVAAQFTLDQTELLLKFGFGVVNAVTFGSDPAQINSISKSIVAFFLVLRNPLFGTGNQIQEGSPTDYTMSSGPFNNTGVNNTKVYDELVFPVDNRTYVIGNWTFQPAPTYKIYNFSFAFFTNTSYNASNGLIQAMGETLNCLLGPDTPTCVGPPVYGPYPINGTTGCLGDLPIAAANAFRDVYTAIIEWIGDGLFVIEAIFLQPDQIGEAIKQFIIDFFAILMLIVKNAQIIVDAMEQVIVQVVSFIFGDGVGKFVQFVLDVISKVISIFINVIQGLIAPFLTRKRSDGTGWYDPDGWTRWSNCGYAEIVLGICATQDYSNTLEGAYSKGQDAFYEFVQDGTVSPYYSMFETEEESKDKRTTTANGPPILSKTLKWARKYAGEFSGEDAKHMTDGFCKDVLTLYNEGWKSNSLTPIETFLWGICFVGWSLPNEIYAATGSKVNLPPDFFYNFERSLPMVASAFKTADAYFNWQNYHGASTTTSSKKVHTQLIPVPEQILMMAENQRRLYSNSLKGYGSFKKREQQQQDYDYTAPLSFAKDVLKMRGETVQKNSCFQTEGNPDEYYCFDEEELLPGLTVKLKPRDTHNRKGPPSSQQPPSYFESLSLEPFMNKPVGIFTSLGGEVFLNLTGKYGGMVPVMNGKIAIRIPDYDFDRYMKENSLDTEFNRLLIDAYETRSDVYLRENYLRLQSAFQHLSGTVIGGSSETQQRHQQNQEDLGPPNKNKRSLEENNNEGFVKPNFKELRLGGWFKLLADAALGPTIAQKPLTYKEQMDIITDSFKDITKDIKLLGVGAMDLIKKKPTTGIDSDKFFSTGGIGREKRDDPGVLDAMQARYEEGVAEINEMGVYKHYFKRVIPQTFHHLAKTIKGYLNHENVPKLHFGTELTSEDGTKATHEHREHKKRSLDENLSEEEVDPKDVLYWVIDENGLVSPSRGEKVWNLEGEKGKILGDTGVEYGIEDTVYVLFDANGDYRTYKNLHLTMDWNQTTFEKDVLDPTYVLDPTEFAGGEKIAGLSVSLNYYEKFYSSQTSHIPCMNDTMWLKKYLMTKESETVTKFTELIPGSEEHEELETFYKTNHPETSKVFHLAQCYRKTGFSKDHPHQMKYGHLIKGRSLVGYRFSSLMNSYGQVFQDIKDKLSLENVLKNTKKHYIDPWIQKAKDTYSIHGKAPTLSKAYFSMERTRVSVTALWASILGSMGKDAAEISKDYLRYMKEEKVPHVIPDVVLASLGHPMVFEDESVEQYKNEDENKKRFSVMSNEEVKEEMLNVWKNNEWERLFSGWVDPSVHPETSKALKRVVVGKSSLEKRQTSFDAPILFVCLPKNASNSENIINTCDYCHKCPKRECAYCDTCSNCTFFENGTSLCKHCANCRVEGPYCDGGCTECTGCTSRVACLDCTIVDRILPFSIFIAYQAAFPSPLVQLPNVSLICVVPFNVSSPYPVYSDYGFNNILQFFVAWFDHFINVLFKADVFQTGIDWLNNLNLNPWDACVGFRFFIERRIPWPILYKCNYDIDTSGNLGLGLEKALEITVPTTAVIVLVGLLFYPQATMIMYVISGGSLAMSFLGFTVQVAWLYNPTCFNPSSNNLLTFLGYIAFPIPIVPLKAGREIYDLFNKIFANPCWTGFPACLTTDNVTCPATCDDYIHIVNFTGLGFTNGYTTLFYAMQRYLPNRTKYILTEYLNTTCLVEGGCMFSDTNCNGTGTNKTCVPNGMLAPLFQHNFQDDINNASKTCEFDNSFYIVAFSMAQLFVPILLALLFVVGLYFLILLIFGFLGLTLGAIPASFRPGASLTGSALGPGPMSMDWRYA